MASNFMHCCFRRCGYAVSAVEYMGSFAPIPKFKLYMT